MFKKLLLVLTVCASMLGCSKDTKHALNLTDEEKAFIETTVVKMSAGSHFPPFLYSPNGEPTGLSIEYVKEISKRTGLKVRILRYPSFPAALDGFARKEVDMISSLGATVDRMDTMSFTSSYVSVGSTMLLNELPVNIPLRVGYARFYAGEEFIERMGTQLLLFKFDNDEKVFFGLMNGEVDGAIMDNSSARFFETKYNRKFARSYVDFTYDLRFGVQKDNRILHEILEKAILSLSEEDHRRLRTGLVYREDLVDQSDDD